MSVDPDLLTFATSGASGRLMCKYREVGTFGPWSLRARSRDLWEVVAEKTDLDDFAVNHLGDEFIVELSFGPRIRGLWRAPVTVVRGSDKLLLEGNSPVEVVDG